MVLQVQTNSMIELSRRGTSNSIIEFPVKPVAQPWQLYHRVLLSNDLERQGQLYALCNFSFPMKERKMHRVAADAAPAALRSSDHSVHFLLVHRRRRRCAAKRGA
jgi:hypothetical protein